MKRLYLSLNLQHHHDLKSKIFLTLVVGIYELVGLNSLPIKDLVFI